ncbi:thiolase family protein [Lactobacillus sp. ESL0679]|uniref:thiolase family protein n=1 Tax=Lactobacillus sp. ESL0679 TaxID=2983209 RepID=UPI0023F64878|nr:thiolase family protein [Lactobacillus sp. ESL0679]MDF7683663.1 thiolase family protein [Lactobacillus sp. ESL0679]
MKDIFVVAAKRTPFGRYRGQWTDQNAVDLGQLVLTETLRSIGVESSELDALFMGNVLGSGLGQNMARQVAINAGMKTTSSSVTINEVCGSSLKALRLAQGQMELGDFDFVAVGGSESMTNAVYYNEVRNQPAENSIMMSDGLTDAFSRQLMGVTAENVAEKYHISRQEMDSYSVQSHQKAAQAVKEGYFASEMISLSIDGRRISQDENIRSDTNMAALAKLSPAFVADGQVTAGNSSPLSDGASMVLLATATKVKELGLKPLARLGAFAESGTDSAYMGFAPYYAVQKLLRRTDHKITDYDVVEVNEAFAAPSVALAHALAIPQSHLNIFGGAIAVGHPLAATGTRLVATAINALNHVNGNRALVTLCIGGGQAIACELIRVE